MKFLLPVGGIIDHRFGILTTPGHKGIPSGILAGMDWAADNQAFTKGFDPNIYFPWLGKMAKYQETCLFVPVPDVVGDAVATIELFAYWWNHMWTWPLAFIAQDRQECLDFPDPQLWSWLFIGGSTEWKIGPGAAECIRRAQSLGKRIHIGRVNWWKRYHYFAGLPGSEEFTCDGTRTRFDGTQKTVEAWADYMEHPCQKRLDLSGGYHGG